VKKNSDVLKFSRFVNIVSVQKFHVRWCSIDRERTIHRDVLYAVGFATVPAVCREGFYVLQSSAGGWLIASAPVVTDSRAGESGLCLTQQLTAKRQTLAYR
jgi:hypothetical protein